MNCHIAHSGVRYEHGLVIAYPVYGNKDTIDPIGGGCLQTTNGHVPSNC